MRKHTTGLALVSISFDESMKQVERALKQSVEQNSALVRLVELGVTGAGGHVSQSALEALRREGVTIDRSAEGAVLGALEVVGVDFDQLAVLERAPFRAAFGENAELFLVSSDKLRDLCYQAVGGGAPPVLFVIDRRGTLRYAGYPAEDRVTRLVEALLAERPSG